jgi:uncharacterized protein YukJ
MEKKTVFNQVAFENHYYQKNKDNLSFKPYTEQAIENIDNIIDNYFPSGSGIDSSCKYDKESSTPEKIVITFGFHFMNDNGFYDGWIDYKLIVKADKNMVYPYIIKIVGKDRQDVKSYLYDIFYTVLKTEYKT